MNILDTTMNKLMPVLKPAGYRKDVPLFIKESILDNPESPVVAYGHDKEDRIEYEYSQNEEEFRKHFEACKKEALKNLKSVNPNIEIQEVEGYKVAFVTGHEYASEKLLDTDFINELGNQLGDASLMVGVPFKGLLIAAGSSSSLRAKLPVVIQKYYDNPQQDVISPYVFLVENGLISAMGGHNVPNNNEAQYSFSENFDTHNFTVETECKSIEELKDVVNATYPRILLTVMKSGEFGGEILYDLKPNLPLDDALIKKCNSMVEQIKTNEMAQTIVKALAKNGINPIFKYDGKQIAPAMNETLEKETKERTESKEDNPYKSLSIQELDQEFYKITSVPNARTHVPSLEKMVNLMAEYEKRGEEVPSERKQKTSHIKQSKPKSALTKKPWWKFW